MGEQGAATTSMRQLASACDINVATLYHYFPSKADLIRAVIEERGYLHGLAIDVPVDRRGTPQARLARLVRFLGHAVLGEETVWRLILGEAVHSDPVSVATAAQLNDELLSSLRRWIPELVPEFTGDADVLARVLRAQLFALMVEALIDVDDRDALIGQRAADIAASLAI